MTQIQSTSLYFHEGNSDKEYHAAIEPKGEGYIVTFAYGRRGNTLTVGTKTPHLVSLRQVFGRGQLETRLAETIPECGPAFSGQTF